MTSADRLLEELRAAEQAAKEAYIAAVANNSGSVLNQVRLGREFAAATAKLDGAREMLRAVIADG